MFIYSYPRPKKGRALNLNNSVRSNDTDIENLNELFKQLGLVVEELSPEIDVYQLSDVKEALVLTFLYFFLRHR